MKLVLDASAAIKWFAAEPDSSQALQLLQGDYDFLAPDILPLEVAAVLLRKQRRGDVMGDTANTALTELDRIGCDFIAHAPLLRRAVALSTRHRLGVMDCLYLDVARERALPIATFDSGMRQLAGHLDIRLWTPDP